MREQQSESITGCPGYDCVSTEDSKSVKVETLSEDFKRFLLEPFMVHMKAGVVESVIVGKNEPASITNIKKSILSQIQLDIAGTRRTELESNHIQLPSSEGTPV